ncbi:hypothetical protein Patl1_02629 [Pistacia atlantica]|uniref:Uncharacterized protein n=1 Tax=Pistacia atlantica TaxID=434234 RepID=A0ACC1CA22_9ROSI|nr:hypothetical protein Patl1_02629 [Pistacia atlantica]
MFEEGGRMSLLEMLLALLRAFSKSLATLSNVDRIYAEMKKVKKSSSAQLNKIEAKLNISKVEMAEKVEAMGKNERLEVCLKESRVKISKLESEVARLNAVMEEETKTELEKFKAKASKGDAPAKEVAEVAPTPKDTPVPFPQP